MNFKNLLIIFIGSLFLASPVMAKEDWEKADARIAALEAQVLVLQGQVTSLLDMLEDVTRFTDEFGYDTLLFSGMNVQIVNGLPFQFPAQNRDTNGLGNLIIGLNVPRIENGNCYAHNWLSCEDERSGSHMLVIGDGHNYSSFGGMVAGDFNETSGPLSSVFSGLGNIASGDAASISGGLLKTATGDFCIVGDDGVDC